MISTVGLVQVEGIPTTMWTYERPQTPWMAHTRALPCRPIAARVEVGLRGVRESWRKEGEAGGYGRTVGGMDGMLMIPPAFGSLKMLYLARESGFDRAARLGASAAHPIGPAGLH